MTSILTFLKGLNWKIYAGIASLLILGATVWYCSQQVDERVDQAEETGQIKEQKKQLEETVKNVETANEARKDIISPGPTGDLARYNQCMRTARTPENCKRLLLNVQED